MKVRQRLARVGLIGAAVTSLGLLVGCTGVSQQDLTAVKAQLAAKEQELAAATRQIDDLKKAPQAAPSDGAIPIYAARRVPPAEAAPPAPQPVPAPQGLPAEYTQAVGPYTMYIEHVAGAGPSKFGLLHALGCVQENVFKRGMKVVFRIELYDTATDRRVIPDGQTTVKVRLPSGEELPLNFGRRGGPQGAPDAPWQWVAAWHVPTDFPLGSVDYAVQVTDRGGRATSLKPPVLKNATDLRIID